MLLAKRVADGLNRGQRRGMRGSLRALALMIVLLQGCRNGANPAVGRKAAPEAERKAARDARYAARKKRK